MASAEPLVEAGAVELVVADGAVDIRDADCVHMENTVADGTGLQAFELDREEEHKEVRERKNREPNYIHIRTYTQEN